MEAQLIDGLAHFCQRYNGVVEEKTVVSKLATTRGGARGLLGRAAQLHLQTGNARPHCVAAAAVEQVNAKRGGKKLTSWWKA